MELLCCVADSGVPLCPGQEMNSLFKQDGWIFLSVWIFLKVMHLVIDSRVMIAEMHLTVKIIYFPQ